MLDSFKETVGMRCACGAGNGEVMNQVEIVLYGVGIIGNMIAKRFFGERTHADVHDQVYLEGF